MPRRVALLLVAACAPPVHPSSFALVGFDGGREPDGVFLDVPTAKPEPQGEGSAGGTIALTPPVAREEVQTLLHGYFRVFCTGDAAGLAPLLTPTARRVEDATLVDLGAAIERRIRAVDATHVPLGRVAAYDQAQVVPYAVATPSMRSDLAMQPGDVWVSVPIAVQFDAGARIFGPRVAFSLRLSPGVGWQIASVREEDGPWT